MPEEALPRLDPLEAIAFFKAKGFEIGFDWRDVFQEEHARAFTVAKAMSRDLLEDIRAAVDQALSEGQTLEQFKKELRPKLVAKQWWGRKWMTDPATGEARVVQLGSPARLRTIYETNLRTSYMAGRWQRVERTKATLPLLRYVSVMDGREREQHHAWHGTILPIDDPWWDTHFPPCGWGCRCDGMALNSRMVARKGWAIEPPPKFRERNYVNKRTGEVVRLETGIDPGFGYNVGKASLDGLTPAPRTKPAGGEEDALNSAFSDGDFAPVRSFFALFAMKSRAEAMKGKVWRDASGWPLAISLGLLRGADGAMIRLGKRQAVQLAAVATILRSPDRISLVWVSDLKGRSMLMRRYVSKLGLVDMGRELWRWHLGATGKFATGHVIWPQAEATPTS